MVTRRAPSRFAMVAQSMAVLPAPITTTLRPIVMPSAFSLLCSMYSRPSTIVLFARDPHGRRRAEADAQKDRVEARSQIVERQIRAELAFRSRCFTPRRSIICDFGQRRLDGLAQRDDAVGRESARQRAFFKDRYGVAAPGQFAGAGEPRGPAPMTATLCPVGGASFDNARRRGP